MPICKRCGDITERKHPNTKYCNGCRKIVDREFRKRYQQNNREKMAEYQNNYRKKFGNYKPKKKICNWCKKLKDTHARGLCVTCYNRFLWINKKVEGMSEMEKHDYFRKWGYLEIEKELTIEDLKRDLGVI